MTKTRTNWLLLIGALLFLSLGTFAVPYIVPVKPSMSQSWVTGFNNRAALVAFLLGGVLFALATNGPLPPPRTADKRLPRWTFGATVFSTTLLGLLWNLHRVHDKSALGGEAPYELDRQMHLDAGQRLYRDFEYVYGPLLLYPGHWVKVALHISSVHGYYISLTLQWILAAAMIWFIVAKTDMPTRSRAAILVLLLGMTWNGIPSEGINFAGTRMATSPVLCLAIYTVWERYRKPYLTATMMVLSIGLAFGVSGEQGFALTLGMSAYVLWLSWRDRTIFPWGAAAFTLFGGLFVTGVADAAGVLNTLKLFANGGYCFPLLPSPINLFILATYVCGLGVLIGALRSGEFDTVAVPLGLCGIPLLASATGRCDVGHLLSAMPLLLVAMFAIAGHRRLFWPWLALLCVTLVWGPVLRTKQYVSRHFLTAPGASAMMADAPDKGFGPAVPIQARDSYFAPLGYPFDVQGSERWKTQSGYYFGLIDLISSQAIASKGDEIRQRKAPYLLLPDTGATVKAEFWDADTKLPALHQLEFSPWIPRQVHAPISKAAIEDTIETMYEPTHESEGGWRVWKMR